MKIKLMRILIAVVCGFILAGVGLTVGVLVGSKDRNTLRVELQEGKPESIVFEDLNMAPGKSTEYTISLTNDVTGDCALSFSFEELEDSPLKQYVYATVEINGESVCDELLADLLDGHEITTDITLHRSEPTTVTVRYSMPVEIGNEAQNTTASFQINLTASNQ